MEDQGIRSNVWRWWCGGSVIAIAIVLGCATAVDFKHSGREAGASRGAEQTVDQATEQTADRPAKISRGTASEPGQEPMHNGGKVRMPVSVSFGGEPSISITRDKVIEVAVSAEGDISNIQGAIVGIDGLEGVEVPLSFAQLASGETQYVNVAVPAKNGRLVLRMQGLVGGNPMSTGLELEVKNPKEASSDVANPRMGMSKSSVRKSTGGTQDQPVTQDSNGQVVQPMRATED